MPENHVCPKPIAKTDASAALTVGWARAIAKFGKGSFSDAIGVDTKTVSRAMSGDTVPELHTALNSLRADPTALNELFALYGFHPPREREPKAANDLHTIAGLSDVVREFCDALQDGERDHVETLRVADKLREVMPAITELLNEAHRIKGVAA